MKRYWDAPCRSAEEFEAFRDLPPRDKLALLLCFCTRVRGHA